jgi:hypothetical protein
MQVLTGPTLTMTTTTRVGRSMRVIGTMRTTATTTIGDITRPLFGQQRPDRKVGPLLY